MKTISTVPNQTLFDVAVRYYGTVEAIGELLADNPDLRNDPDAMVALGIDPLADPDVFYPDIALAVGQAVAINSDSATLHQAVVRELLGREINTFDL